MTIFNSTADFRLGKRLGLKYLILMSAITIVLSTVLGITIWSKDRENLLQVQIESLHAAADIFFSDLQVIRDSMLTQNNNFALLPGMDERLKKAVSFGPMHLIHASEQGKQQDPSGGIYGINAQVRILETLRQLIDSNGLSSADFYLAPVGELLKELKPVKFASATKTESTIFHFDLMGDVSKWASYTKANSEESKPDSYFDGVAVMGPDAQLVFKENGFKRVERSAAELILTDKNFAPDKSIANIETGSDGVPSIRITTPLKLKLYDVATGATTETTIGYVSALKPINQQFMAAQKARLKVETGLAVAGKLALSTVSGNAGALLVDGNVAEVAGEKYVYSTSAPFKLDGGTTISLVTLTKYSVLERKIFGLVFAVFNWGMILTVVSLGVKYYATNKMVVAPITHMLEVVNQVEANDDPSVSIEITSQDEIAFLGHNFNKMIKKLREGRDFLEEKVQQRTGKIQDILNHIEQGIVTFGADLKIEDEFSRFVTTFYNKAKNEVAGAPVLETVFSHSDLDADLFDRLRESLICTVGEHRMSWMVNSDHFPTEATLQMADGPRYIALDWTAIIDKSNLVQRVMLSIRDLTRQHALEQKVAAQRTESERMMTKIAEIVRRKRVIAANFVIDAKQRIEVLAAGLKDPPDLAKVLRELHTIKGASRVLGFKSLALITHNVEDRMRSLAAVHFDAATIRIELKKIEAEVDEYTEILSTVLGGNSATALEHSLPSIHGLVSHSIEQINKQIESTSIALGGIDCIDRVLNWRLETFSDIEALILHALTNSVDHGYVLPAQSGKAVGSVNIVVRAELKDQFVSISIADDGAGFDLAKINDLAEKRQFKPSNLQSALDVLFTDGMSTAVTVSMTSGRGVGLSAIKGIVEKYGGTVHLELNEPSGAKVVALLPKEAVLAGPSR